MRKSLTIFTIIFAASLFAQAQPLPAKVNNFLKKHYPDWELSKFHKVEYQENKSIAKGDFNGDGKTDYAVVINKDDRVYTLVLFAAKTSYKAVNLLAQGKDEHWIAGIGIIAKGSKLDVYNDNQERIKSFRLKSDAVSIYDGEGHGQIYYWENGKFLFTREY